MVTASSPSPAQRVRFAPSPTGYLHIGGVRTALFNWLWARKTGGAFILRIEDTDQGRSTAESRAVILESLTWLGIDWDEGPDKGGPYGPYTQMERLALYRGEADKLIVAGKAYRCYCTKEELDRERAALKAKDPKASFRYPGTCRDRKDQPDKPFVVRFKTPTSGAVRYVDKVFGEVTTPNSEQQDFVLLRSDGVPLYNFGATVDDITMKISLVARGRDHMVNTPPQILLYEAFGAKPPEFAHLPMMLAPSGDKLSKRHGAVSVGEYRDQGYAPSAVLNYLARFGWSFGDQEIFSRQDLVDKFDWAHCGRGDGKFDAKKFLAINYEHLKSQDLVGDREYAERVLPFLKSRGVVGATQDAVEKLVPLIRERAHTFVEAADALDYFFRTEPVTDEKAAAKFLVPTASQPLRDLAGVLADLGAWTGGRGEWNLVNLKEALDAWLLDKKLTMKDVAQPARVALTGRTASPGLHEVLVGLGREVSLARLERGATRAEGGRAPPA
jgi:glutamyl-tRNA synthetase